MLIELGICHSVRCLCCSVLFMEGQRGFQKYVSE